MTTPRLATYAVNGSTCYGAVVDGGIVDLVVEVEADGVGVLHNTVIDETP